MNKLSSKYDRRLTEAIGPIVRHLRVTLGYTQTEFAERARLHRAFISDIERGCRNMSVGTLTRIATALGMRPSDLLSRAETVIGPK